MLAFSGPLSSLNLRKQAQPQGLWAVCWQGERVKPGQLGGCSWGGVQLGWLLGYSRGGWGCSWGGWGLQLGRLRGQLEGCSWGSWGGAAGVAGWLRGQLGGGTGQLAGGFVAGFVFRARLAWAA